MLPVKDSSYYGTKFGVLAVEANSAVSAWRPTTYDIGTFQGYTLGGVSVS
jgi:hypothetical protein